MPTERLIDLLHLYHSLAPDTARLSAWLERFAYNPSRLRGADAQSLQQAGIAPKNARQLQRDCWRQVERDLAWSEARDHHLIAIDDPAYPALLRELNDPPPLLYARGQARLLQTPQVAIVGSRRCSASGARHAAEFAAELAAAGLVITSGLALGIDSAAHGAALQQGGATVAVIGTGIDVDYPRRNRKLAAGIREQGLMISEFALGTPALPHHFPQRNRIISGLALATLVIEAAARSGSLITARLAAEQGREVLALPGSIHNPLARGCHRLIRDGASLAESPRDVIEQIEPLLNFALESQPEARPKASEALNGTQQKLLEAIGYEPVNCDILVQRSGLTIAELSSILPVLEIKDLIQSAPGGCYVRIK